MFGHQSVIGARSLREQSIDRLIEKPEYQNFFDEDKKILEKRRNRGKNFLSFRDLVEEKKQKLVNELAVICFDQPDMLLEEAIDRALIPIITNCHKEVDSFEPNFLLLGRLRDLAKAPYVEVQKKAVRIFCYASKNNEQILESCQTWISQAINGENFFLETAVVAAEQMLYNGAEGRFFEKKDLEQKMSLKSIIKVDNDGGVSKEFSKQKNALEFIYKLLSNKICEVDFVNPALEEARNSVFYDIQKKAEEILRDDLCSKNQVP